MQNVGRVKICQLNRQNTQHLRKVINPFLVNLILPRMKLELALMTLTESSKHCCVKFWGKVEGIKNDYYVACGLNFRG